MQTSSSRKEESHNRIVRAASRAIRSRGLSGVGVAEVMNEAGLTHGGFYAHFESKTALLAEAADRAGAEGIEALGRVAAEAAPGQGLATLIDAYLSGQHVENAADGCPIAAYGSEIPRQEPEVRAAATRRMKELVGLLERLMPDWGQPEAHQRALATLGGLVGGLVIARASSDPQFSRSIRKATRDRLLHELKDAGTAN